MIYSGDRKRRVLVVRRSGGLFQMWGEWAWVGDGVSCWSACFPALWEAVLGTLLLIGSLTLHFTNDQQVHEISIFSAVLFVQSLPFLAAVAIALIERSPFNAFATWRRLATLSTYLPRGPAPTAGPSPGSGIGIVP